MAASRLRYEFGTIALAGVEAGFKLRVEITASGWDLKGVVSVSRYRKRQSGVSSNTRWLPIKYDINWESDVISAFIS